LTPACPDAILKSVEAIARLMPNDLNRRCPEAIAPHRGVIATYQRLAIRHGGSRAWPGSSARAVLVFARDGVEIDVSPQLAGE